MEHRFITTVASPEGGEIACGVNFDLGEFPTYWLVTTTSALFLGIVLLSLLLFSSGNNHSTNTSGYGNTLAESIELCLNHLHYSGIVVAASLLTSSIIFMGANLGLLCHVTVVKVLSTVSWWVGAVGAASQVIYFMILVISLVNAIKNSPWLQSNDLQMPLWNSYLSLPKIVRITWFVGMLFSTYIIVRLLPSFQSDGISLFPFPPTTPNGIQQPIPNITNNNSTFLWPVLTSSVFQNCLAYTIVLIAVLYGVFQVFLIFHLKYYPLLLYVLSFYCFVALLGDIVVWNTVMCEPSSTVYAIHPEWQYLDSVWFAVPTVYALGFRMSLQAFIKSQHSCSSKTTTTCSC